MSMRCRRKAARRIRTHIMGALPFAYDAAAGRRRMIIMIAKNGNAGNKDYAYRTKERRQI